MVKNQNNKQVKINNKFIKALPFSAMQAREGGFTFASKFGENGVMIVKSKNNINHYDMITFLQVVKDFVDNEKEWESAGNINGSPLVKRNINISDLLKKRNISLHTRNVTRFISSLERLIEAKIVFLYNQGNEKKARVTQYFYDGGEINFTRGEVEIIANKGFLLSCKSQKAILINFEDTITYKSTYAALLDIYMQSQKYNTGKKIKNGKFIYDYSKKIDEEQLLVALKLIDSSFVCEDDLRIAYSKLNIPHSKSENEEKKLPKKEINRTVKNAFKIWTENKDFTYKLVGKKYVKIAKDTQESA